MFKLSNILLRCPKNSQTLIRISPFSSATTATAHNILEGEVKSIGEQQRASEKPDKERFVLKSSNSMVTAAFAALKSDVSGGDIKTPQTDAKLAQATTINELLLVSEGTGVSRKHALKVMSILADWCSSGKVNLSDFETDPRFVRLCRVLTKGVYLKPKTTPISAKSEDLSVVMNVAADDEAAKLVGSISLIQMVKVISTLAQQKRRSTSLLRALAFNISGAMQTLNIKQCSDVLYSAATLNFYDPNLMQKVCGDVCRSLTQDVKKSATVGSVLTSLGLLKYKDIEALDKISEWILKNHSICRPQDIFALIQTLAVLNHQPPNFDWLCNTLQLYLKKMQTSNTSEWLDIVWSSVLLNVADEQQVSSVLDENFVTAVAPYGVATKLKLLNINAYTEYILKDYSGPKLKELKDMELARSKDKEQIATAVLDTLKNLMAEWCLRSNINTKMGFFLDAECYLDKKGNPVPLKKVAESDQNLVRIGILVQDYHDFCKGRVEPTGVNLLAIRLLEAQNYRVLTIPYTEFRPRDKLIQRVQYVESKLKHIVREQ